MARFAIAISDSSVWMALVFDRRARYTQLFDFNIMEYQRW